MISHNLVHPNRMGSIRQCSTEDAGIFLTHLVCVGWSAGLKTSVVTFDIVQFFSSLNHAFLLAVLCKQGFPSSVQMFFASYLTGRLHDKTELFHFSRANYEYPVVLDLGYAPYTKDKCLTPKLYWRYLGFFFD